MHLDVCGLLPPLNFSFILPLQEAAAANKVCTCMQYAMLGSYI